jgi:hypothetical protein
MFLVRLSVAYSRYLQFRHAFMAVLASQIIVVLIVLYPLLALNLLMWHVGMR